MAGEILVIDDDPEICRLLSDWLKKDGHRVCCAYEGKEGLKAMVKERPSLILCDVKMSPLDGIEVLQEVKRIDKELPVIMISGSSTHDKVVKALDLGALDFIAKPFRLSRMKSVVSKALREGNGKQPIQSVKKGEQFSPTELILRQSYIDILRTLARTLEAKDPYTKKHSAQVTKYAVALAKGLGLPEEQVEVLEHAASLHDIGKIGVSDVILRKPGRLSQEEWGIIKKHPEIGENIIEPLKLLRLEQPAIRYHHERYDGKGYPDGLKGKEIPIQARILAIADAYEAMTSERPYRRAMTDKEAKDEMIRSSGKQFDLELAALFLKIVTKKLRK